MQNFEVQVLHSRTQIVNAVLRSKYRLIDELVHIPRGQGCMRLVLCRQDCTELRTRHGVYWISNTLTSDISNRQMVDIAASLTR